MDSLQQQFVSVGGALLCAGIASFHDLRERRIPNWLTASTAVVAVTLHAASGGWRGLGESALAGLIAGLLGFALWIAGGMGAGDVKLMAAVGCCSSLVALRAVLFSTALAGAAFAIVFSIFYGRFRETLSNVGELIGHHGRHGLKPHPDLNLSNPDTLRMPFALPVAGGCLVALGLLVWEAHS